MKSKLDLQATREQKMQQAALGRLLKVSHDDLKQELVEDEKI
jgi:hypothetical protein